MSLSEEGRRKEFFNMLGIASAYEQDRKHGLWLPPESAGHGWVKGRLPPDPIFARAASFQKNVGDGFLHALLEHRPRGRDDARTFPNGRWHLSISHNRFGRLHPGVNTPGRMPTWEEIKEARYKFLPKGVNMAIMFPPEELYYSLHATCLHLLEVPVGLALNPNARGGI